jgi:hypothetical protein
MKSILLFVLIGFFCFATAMSQNVQPPCNDCGEKKVERFKKPSQKKSAKKAIEKSVVIAPKSVFDTLGTPSPEISYGIFTGFSDSVKPTGRTKAIIEARGIFSATPIADWSQINAIIGYRLSQKWRKEFGLYGAFSASRANIVAESAYVNIITGMFYSPIKGVRISLGGGTELTNMESHWVAQGGIQIGEYVGGTIRTGASGTQYRILAGITTEWAWIGVNAESLPYQNGDVVGPYVQIPVDGTPFTLVGGIGARINNDVPSEMRWSGSAGISASLF